MITKQIEEIIQEQAFQGDVLIAKEDKILFHKGYGHRDVENNLLNDGETKYPLASITKQFTAAAILLLANEEKLHLEDTLDKYFDGFPTGNKMTIHHVLSNSSGIPNFSLEIDFTPFLAQKDVTKALIDYIKTQPSMFEPGSQFFYSISGYLVLQKIIEQVSGLSYIDYLKKHFFIPHHLDSIGFELLKQTVDHLAKGYIKEDNQIIPAKVIDMRIAGGGGALYATARDLFQWTRLLRKNQILPKKYTDLMFSKHIQAHDVNHYGYGMIIAKGDMVGKHRIKYYHPGTGFGSRTFLSIFPAHELTIIILSNMNHRASFEAVRQALDRLLLNTYD